MLNVICWCTLLKATYLFIIIMTRPSYRPLSILHIPPFFEPIRSKTFFDFNNAISRSVVGLLNCKAFAISFTVTFGLFSTIAIIDSALYDKFNPSFNPSCIETLAVLVELI